MSQRRAGIVVRASLGLALLWLAGCDQCGRRLFFVVEVRSDDGAPIAGATVSIACLDAADRSELTSEATSDDKGEAVPAVHALNRQCPEDPFPHAAFFESCTISVRAGGLADQTIRLTGPDLDALPPVSFGQAGDGVLVRVTLRR